MENAFDGDYDDWDLFWQNSIPAPVSPALAAVQQQQPQQHHEQQEPPAPKRSKASHSLWDTTDSWVETAAAVASILDPSANNDDDDNHDNNDVPTDYTPGCVTISVPPIQWLPTATAAGVFPESEAAAAEEKVAEKSLTVAATPVNNETDTFFAEWGSPISNVSGQSFKKIPGSQPLATSTPLVGHSMRSKNGKKLGGAAAASLLAAENARLELASLTYPELVQRYTALMEKKQSMTGRVFNKAVLELLAVFASKSPGDVPTAGGGSAITGGGACRGQLGRDDDDEWNSEKLALAKFRDELLNEKEMASETLVERVVEYIQTKLSPSLTADERKETLLKKSLSFVLDISPQLSIKTSPLIRSYVNRIFDSQMDNLFAEIVMPEMPLREKSLMYSRMFGNFIDSDKCVSFAATNKALLGKLSMRDLFFLTFYACVTSRRHRGDNLLQIGVCGRSSVGKSLLVENVLMQSAHQLLTTTSSSSSDGGCGRFAVGKVGV